MSYPHRWTDNLERWNNDPRLRSRVWLFLGLLFALFLFSWIVNASTEARRGEIRAIQIGIGSR